MSGEKHCPTSDRMQPTMSDAEKSEAELVYEQKKKEKEADDEKKFQESQRQLRLEIAQQEEEIRMLKAKQEDRKKKREEEQAQMEEKRKQEEIRRREEEAAKRRQKEDAERRLKEEKRRRSVELQTQTSPDKKRNFVVAHKSQPSVPQPVDKTAAAGSVDADKTKEQLEQQKAAVLKERIVPLAIDGFDAAQLADKAKELHDKLYRLESEKYDLEDTVKRQLYDLMELAERSRQMNKAGYKNEAKNLEKPSNQRNMSDPIMAKYSQVPPKISICSKYERRKDLRDFSTRKNLFEGKKNEQNAQPAKAEA